MYRCTLKRHFLARKHVVWAIKRENRSNGSTWAQDREKITGQNSQRSHKGVIFHLFGEKLPLNRFLKNCTVVAVLDIITCANFWAKIFRGYDYTGVEFPVLLLILAWTLQQCSAYALPLIVNVLNVWIFPNVCKIECFVFHYRKYTTWVHLLSWAIFWTPLRKLCHACILASS